MELILKETIDSLGREGDVVKVKPGYGRNFLLPKGKAVLANAANLEILQRNKAVIEQRIEAEKQDAEKLAKKLSGVTLEFAQLVGEDDKLFGSVTVTDICEKLGESNIEIEKKNVLLTEPIKSLGENKIPIKVGFEITAEIIVNVVAQGEES